MAGFKLFNYEKPGPGVDKDAPKKSMFFQFFDIFTRKFWQLILVNLLYVLLSLPVLTNGFACAGATYITRNFVREKPTFVVSDFFGAIRKNWKQALVIGIINLLIDALLIYDIYFFLINFSSSWFFVIGLVISFTVMFYFLFIQYYIYLLMVTFDLSIRQLYKNSLILAAAGMKNNLLLTFILIALYALVFGVPLLVLFLSANPIGMFLALLLVVFFLPSWRILLTQFCVFPVVKKHMIDPYYEEHPEAAEQEKQLLNLQDVPDEDEEAIFKDMGSAEQTPDQEDPAPLEKKKSRQKNMDDDGTI